MTKMKQLPPISVTNASAIATVYTPPGTHEGGVEHRVVEKSSSQFLSSEEIFKRLERLKKLIMEGSEGLRIHQEARTKLLEKIEEREDLVEIQTVTVSPVINDPARKKFEKKLAAILKTVNGNRNAAAKEMGCTYANVVLWIKEAEEGSPLERYNQIKGRGGPTVRVSDEVLDEVHEKHWKDPKETAREVGYADGSVVRNRIRRAKPGSPLKKSKKTK